MQVPSLVSKYVKGLDEGVETLLVWVNLGKKKKKKLSNVNHVFCVFVMFLCGFLMTEDIYKEN